MSSVTIRGAMPRRLELHFTDNGQPYARLYMQGDWTPPLREAMGWDDIPDCTRGGVKLTGEIAATNFILFPSDSKLKDQAIDIAVSEIGNFELITTKPEEDGGSSRRFVNFIIRCQFSEDSVQWISAYMHHIGQDRGRLKIVYPEQTVLEFGKQAAAEDEDDNDNLVGDAKAEWDEATTTR